MMPSFMRCGLITLFLLAANVPVETAFACACCTSTGERFDLVSKFDAYHFEEMHRLRFDNKATLFLGEAEPDSVKGIANAAAQYELQSWWQERRLVFTFHHPEGHSGTLSLVMPRTISTFSVDPREQPESARHGPSLYKEWRLISPAAGSGIFSGGIASGQNLKLVLQGRGNNCTSANDFSHWMLAMFGPKAKYHFFGSLITAR